MASEPNSDRTSSNNESAGTKAVIVQYVLVRTDLKWGTGAMVAQACHASMAAVASTLDKPATKEYLGNLTEMHKVVLNAEKEEDLLNVEGRLKEADIPHHLWIEQPENVASSLACSPQPKHLVQAIFKGLKLLKSDDQQDSPDHQGDPKKFRLKLSERLHWTAVLAFISYLILLISFASPYWLSSYKFTDSAFKRLGLWDFCFEDYRHPAYQYDTKFNGCHWVYSPVYATMRDWLQPGWFMFVQANMTIALCLSSIGLVAVSVIFMHFLIRYQLAILSISLICHMFTTMLIAFALIIFYSRAFDRSWIMYPEFNHVDWAFFFAMVSMFGNGFATVLYYREVQVIKERMLKLKRLIIATPNGRPVSATGGESLDAVYAARSTSIYNHQQLPIRNDNSAKRQQMELNNNNDTQRDLYSHFTQV